MHENQATEKGVTLDNYNKIKSGMTQDEVRKILGVPSSSERQDGRIFDYEWSDMFVGLRRGGRGNALIYVYYDENRRVVSKDKVFLLY